MAQDKTQIKSTYPLPVYNYRVTILQDGKPLALSFAEVSGLRQEYEAVTYKHGLSFAMGAKIIPGMVQPLRLTMKRGMAQNRAELQQWLQAVYSDPLRAGAKRDILVDLCDESGKPLIRWTVQGALPVKLEAPTFDAKSNEVAIETIELVAHALQVNYQPDV